MCTLALTSCSATVWSCDCHMTYWLSCDCYVIPAVWRGHLPQEEAAGATEGGEEEAEAVGEDRTAKRRLFNGSETRFMTCCVLSEHASIGGRASSTRHAQSCTVQFGTDSVVVRTLRVAGLPRQPVAVCVMRAEVDHSLLAGSTWGGILSPLDRRGWGISSPGQGGWPRE